MLMFTWIEFGFVQLREQSSAWNMDKTGSACNAGSVSCVYHDIKCGMPCTSGITGALKPTNGPTSRGRQASKKTKQTRKQASKQTIKQAHLVPSRCFTLQFSFADSDTNARLYCSLCRILQQWPPTLHQVQTGAKWRISFEGLRKGIFKLIEAL